MTKKKATLSAVQVEVLRHMADGHRLSTATHGGAWLDKVAGVDGLAKRVHCNTVWALRCRGYIEGCDTDKTPYYRNDYQITAAGREVL